MPESGGSAREFVSDEVNKATAKELSRSVLAETADLKLLGEEHLCDVSHCSSLSMDASSYTSGNRPASARDFYALSNAHRVVESTSDSDQRAVSIIGSELSVSEAAHRNKSLASQEFAQIEEGIYGAVASGNHHADSNRPDSVKVLSPIAPQSCPPSPECRRPSKPGRVLRPCESWDRGSSDCSQSVASVGLGSRGSNVVSDVVQEVARDILSMSTLRSSSPSLLKPVVAQTSRPNSSGVFGGSMTESIASAGSNQSVAHNTTSCAIAEELLCRDVVFGQEVYEDLPSTADTLRDASNLDRVLQDVDTWFRCETATPEGLTLLSVVSETSQSKNLLYESEGQNRATSVARGCSATPTDDLLSAEFVETLEKAATTDFSLLPEPEIGIDRSMISHGSQSSGINAVKIVNDDKSSGKIEYLLEDTANNASRRGGSKQIAGEVVTSMASNALAEVATEEQQNRKSDQVGHSASPDSACLVTSCSPSLPTPATTSENTGHNPVGDLDLQEMLSYVLSLRDSLTCAVLLALRFDHLDIDRLRRNESLYTSMLRVVKQVVSCWIGVPETCALVQPIVDVHLSANVVVLCPRQYASDLHTLSSRLHDQRVELLLRLQESLMAHNGPDDSSTASPRIKVDLLHLTLQEPSSIRAELDEETTSNSKMKLDVIRWQEQCMVLANSFSRCPFTTGEESVRRNRDDTESVEVAMKKCLAVVACKATIRAICKDRSGLDDALEHAETSLRSLTHLDAAWHGNSESDGVVERSSRSRRASAVVLEQVALVSVVTATCLHATSSEAVGNVEVHKDAGIFAHPILPSPPPPAAPPVPLDYPEVEVSEAVSPLVVLTKLEVSNPESSSTDRDMSKNSDKEVPRDLQHEVPTAPIATLAQAESAPTTLNSGVQQVVPTHKESLVQTAADSMETEEPERALANEELEPMKTEPEAITHSEESGSREAQTEQQQLAEASIDTGRKGETSAFASVDDSTPVKDHDHLIVKELMEVEPGKNIISDQELSVDSAMQEQEKLSTERLIVQGVEQASELKIEAESEGTQAREKEKHVPAFEASDRSPIEGLPEDAIAKAEEQALGDPQTEPSNEIESKFASNIEDAVVVDKGQLSAALLLEDVERQNAEAVAKAPGNEHKAVAKLTFNIESLEAEQVIVDRDIANALRQQLIFALVREFKVRPNPIALHFSNGSVVVNASVFCTGLAIAHGIKSQVDDNYESFVQEMCKTISLIGSLKSEDHRITNVQVIVEEVSQRPHSAPRVAYRLTGPRFDLTVGVPVRLQPTVQGVSDNCILHFSVSPELPLGLQLDSATGVISGTPSATASAERFGIEMRVEAMNKARPPLVVSTKLEVSDSQSSAGADRDLTKTSTKDAPPDVQAKAKTAPKPLKPSHEAFAAVQCGDFQALLDLTRKGKLQENQVQSANVTNSLGQTLLDFSYECGNTRAANFFRSGLILGPTFLASTTTFHRSNAQSFSSSANLGTASAEGDGQSVPSKNEYTLQYPSLPDVIPCKRWLQIRPNLCVHSGAKVEVKEFKVTPELPGGLHVDADTGMLLGLPTEEVPAETHEVTVMVLNQTSSTPIRVTCTLSIDTLNPPDGLTYPRIERVVDTSQQKDELPRLENTARGVSGFLTKATTTMYTPPALVSDLSKISSLRSPLRPPKFQVAPFVSAGYVDHYEVFPKLPRGMQLDVKSGMVSGIPELARSRRMFSQIFEIRGHNPAGSCSCTVFLEIIIGSWNLRHVRFFPVNDGTKLEDEVAEVSPAPCSAMDLDIDFFAASIDNQQGDVAPSLPPPPGNESQSQEAQLATTATEQVGWTDVVQRCASILETSGRPIKIKDAGGVDGYCPVWGLLLSALSLLLGFTDDPPILRRLVRTIEQRGHRCPQSLLERGFKVCVSSEHAVSANEVVVYLGRLGAGRPDRHKAMAPTLPPAPPSLPPDELETARQVAKSPMHFPIDSSRLLQRASALRSLLASP